MIKELYEIGLEKCAGDEEAAKEFVAGFLKEAFASEFMAAAAKAAGGAAVGLGAGLAIHGLSTTLRGISNVNLKDRYQSALITAIKQNAILQNAQHEAPERLHSFADTIFKFAPHVAGDPNLLSHILSSVIHGESVDLTTIRALADLDNRYQENRKNSLFTPSSYKM